MRTQKRVTRTLDLASALTSRRCFYPIYPTMMLSRASLTLARRLSARAAVRVNAGSLSHAATRTFSELSTKKVANPEMFCRQCEQTKDNYACT